MRISQNSKTPIYQQIADQFRTQILTGEITSGDYLPSIRELARDLKISVITTMKSYELLESEGLITAVQGKGFLVNEQNSEMMREQHLRKVEDALSEAITCAHIADMSDENLIQTLQTLLAMRQYS